MNTAETTIAAEHTLRELSSSTASLRRALNEVIRDATSAVVALESGQRVSGMVLGHGPLGAQAPFEIAMLTSKIEALLTQAQVLGCSAEQISVAYEVS
jgi:hypothetical protein